MIENQRIKRLNSNTFQKRKYILYWMQASQRTKNNHALDYSIELANRYQKPLVVFLGLTDTFPDANLRHYHFMVQGLKEIEESLENKQIQFIIKKISPEKGIIPLAKDACVVIGDQGYLRIQRQWRKQVAEEITCPFIQVESNIIVPVEEASHKEEYAAYTLRPKVMWKFIDYVKQNEDSKPIKDSLKFDFESEVISNVDTFLKDMNIDTSVKPVEGFVGGEKQAEALLKDFISHKLDTYGSLKNDPNNEYTSHLSPYLHFGQISPSYIMSEIYKKEGYGQYIEELLVRRELAINFVYYNTMYDSFKGLPSWALETLQKHRNDRRQYLYIIEEFEQANTHDPYWNAAQRQMIQTGYMHGYMRMYWGKKILEWTKTPEDAFDIALYLNNKYELDGRDPNGYAGVAWCFGKHDRPWKERQIFGKVRYMNAKGLERKFDIETYSNRFD
jgi:deoxyribodipyrimidine photo-lyase